MGEIDWEMEIALINGGLHSERERSLSLYEYEDFLEGKSQIGGHHGFEPVWMPDFLFDFQQSLTSWAIRKGKGAAFADCGLGKTPMQLVWAENVVRKTGKRVLIITPLAVGPQTIREGNKFGIEVRKAEPGKIHAGINVVNYERLHHFNADDFIGVVLDESSILKSFDGTRRSEITEFMRMRPYRLLCTATASPNDYIELGTSSEALGELGYTDMLGRFFKNDQNTVRPMRKHILGKNFRDPPPMNEKWRFKGHAEIPFYRWVCSWARAGRRPSDFGPFSDERFVLPDLIERQHVVTANSLADGMLFSVPAVGLKEQRNERRRTITERCERVAELCEDHDRSVIWCHLNPEGDLLEHIVKDAVQVSGKDSDDKKEEILSAFSLGQVKRLVTKQKIAGWGMNWQNCSHMTIFPSHSFEQYYQGVRRCWRFGQQNTVTVDVVTTEGEQLVLENLQRKADQSDKLFTSLVAQMQHAQRIERGTGHTKEEKIPSWL